MARSYQFGDFELDGDRRELRRLGRRVPLEPKTLELLTHLVRHRAQTISIPELLRVLWPDTTVGRGSIHRSIGLLRVALAKDISNPDTTIETLPRRGYRFAMEVHEMRDARPPTAPNICYVGRRALRAELEDRLDRALGGHSEVILLHGPAGIGKSATLAELARSATRAGAMVLAGRSVEAPAAPPYRPWSRILRQAIDAGGSSRVLRDLGYGAQDVVRALPELSESLGLSPTPSDLGDAGARYRVHDAIGEWVRSCCRRRPMVLLLDDLNRADLDSIQLLDFLVQELTDERLMLVVAYRDGLDPDPRRETLDQVIAMRPESDIALGEMMKEEIAEFARERTGEAWSEARLERLVDASGGNPLFIEQLLRSDWSIRDQPVPDVLGGGLRGGLRRLLGDASDSCSEMLSFASVFGREFDPVVLAAGLDLPLVEIQTAVDEAIGLRVLERDFEKVDDEDGTRFVHGLLPEILYAQIGSTERGELHRRAVTGILACRTGPKDRVAELAYHSSKAASVSGIAQAFGFGVIAARDAVSRLAYEEAIVLFERALAMRGVGAPLPSERAEVLIELALAMVMRGAAAEAKPRFLEAYDLAQEAGDPVLLARAALGPAQAQEYNQLEGDQSEVLSGAIDTLGNLDPPLRVQLLIALAMTGFYGDRDRSLVASEEALDLARSLGKASLLCASLLARSEALGWTEAHSERLEFIREAFRMASRGSVRPIVYGRALQQMAAERLDAGDRRGFENYIVALEGLASEHRLSYFEWSITSMRGAQAIFEGRFRDGRSLLTKQVELGARSNPKLSMQVAGMQHMFIELAIGDPASVAESMKTFVDRNPEISPWRAALAVALAESGDLDEAKRHVEVLVESDFRPRHRDFLGVVLSGLAETVQLLESEELAIIVSRELARQEMDCIVVGICLAYYGALDRYRGLCAETLGHFDEAIQFYEQALSVDRSMHAHPYVARALHDLGRVLHKRGGSGDRERADRELADALELAEKLGMRSLAGRIRGSCVRSVLATSTGDKN